MDDSDVDPKTAKFSKLLYEDELTDLNELKKIAWNGIPHKHRPITWKLLLGYLPVNKSKREQQLQRKREEYERLVVQYYNDRSLDDGMWRQIHIDIPRMQPLITIFQQQKVQDLFERILYIWSIRHPASGYVQGMNDLVTPFFLTYLSQHIDSNSIQEVENYDIDSLDETTLRQVEADTFWSFCKLLDSIQNNYTYAQPGIQRLVKMLATVVSRADAELHNHLKSHGVDYLQFAFRWMNNLLIRELPLRLVVRLWDSYLAEGVIATISQSKQFSQTNLQLQTTNNQLHVNSSGPSSSIRYYNTYSQVDESSIHNNKIHSVYNSTYGITTPWNNGGGETPFSASFHLFVCAAFLRFWSKSLLRERDFQGLMLLLQNLPTFHWSDKEIVLIVADAYQLKQTFSPSHLKT